MTKPRKPSLAKPVTEKKFSTGCHSWNWKIIPENDFLQLPDQQNIGAPAFKHAKNSMQEQTISMPNLLKYWSLFCGLALTPWQNKTQSHITITADGLFQRKMWASSLIGSCGTSLLRLWSDHLGDQVLWNTRIYIKQGNLIRFKAQRLPSQPASHRTYLQAQNIFTIN